MIQQLMTSNKFRFYSPFFRIFIGLYLLKDILIMWDFNDLIYKGTSFLVPEQSPFLEFLGIATSSFREYFYVFYAVYVLLIFLFLFGIGKRITALLLYFSLEIIQNLAWLTLNGGDNLLKFALLYMIFIDSYDRFAVRKLKHNTIFSEQLSNFISNLGGYSICLHFCVVYLVSAVHKIHADVWFNGIATYYILGAERFSGTPFNLALVKNGIFVTLTTYGTILVELFFPLLIWYRKVRPIAIIAAASLHFGIAIFMMLYDFQILFILTLGFFVTNKEWNWVNEKTKNWLKKKPKRRALVN